VLDSEPDRDSRLLGRSLHHVWAVVWRLFATLAALEFAYLTLANVTLLTPLLQKLAKSDDILVRYDWAYSLVPGRVVVRNLSVRVQDHNIQFLIAIERGSLDVSLHELLRKRFHALRVDADNVSYRMRHKVSRVGKEGPRLAAYPPIEGFADPPLFEGPPEPEPEIPDSQDHLWDVRVEGVTARVREIWILEYRYRGDGTARGNFHVKPSRWYEVYPAALELDGGELTLGSATVARKADAVIDCRVDGSDPRRLSGLEPFRNIHAGIHGRFEDMDLAFLDAYLGPRAGLSARGRAQVRLNARVERGVVVPGTRIELESPDASIGNSRLRVEGASSYRLAVLPDAPGAPLEIGVKSQRLLLEARTKGHASPSIEHLDVRGRVTPDFTGELAVLSAEVAPLELTFPDLGWLAAVAGDLPALRGSGDVRLTAQRNDDKRWSGDVRAKATDVHVAAKKVGFAGSAELETHVTTAPDEQSVTFSPLRLQIPDAVVEVDQRATHPWSALFTSDRLELRPEDHTERARGTVVVHADDATALMPLFVDSPFARNVGDALLGIHSLDAKGAFSVGDVSRFELLRAQAGIAKARGMLSLTHDGPSGAFLVSTGVANLGVRVRSGETRVELFVGTDWLDKHLSRRLP
jgi:hypothetical protein